MAFPVGSLVAVNPPGSSLISDTVIGSVPDTLVIERTLVAVQSVHLFLLHLLDVNRPLLCD